MKTVWRWSIAVAVGLVAVLAPPASGSRAAYGQDGSGKPDLRRIEERVGKVLEEEIDRLRREIAELVESELGGGGSSAPGAAGVEKALALVTEDLLRQYVSSLAGDDFEGRNAGYEGEVKATEYIAGVMKEAGLKPVGDKDDAGNPTYWQHFRTGGRKTRNCLGLLEGADADLKKEIIVVGAHHDHLGTAEQGHWGRLGRPKEGDTIWNGADDNASGTSAVMALARAFGLGGLRPRRSILFMTFSGEEAGLVGSRWYVNHPIAPLAQHVFMVNLDMVGRNPDRAVTMEGVGSAEDGVIRAAAEEAVRKTGLKAVLHDKVAFMGGDSDHSNFRDRGVPFTFIFGGLHGDYHRVTDHADKLAYPKLAKVSRTALYMLQAIADGEKSPRFKGLDLPVPGQVLPRRKLGIVLGSVSEEEYEELGLGKSEGAVRVDEVSEGSVAQKAGLEDGDYILSVDGKKLARDREPSDLRAAIDGISPDKDVPIEILRSKKKIVLKARWEK